MAAELRAVPNEPKEAVRTVTGKRTRVRTAGGDRRIGPMDRRFAFDILKWVVAILVAIGGIYVLSERRAAVSDVSAAYLDKKVDEIKEQNKDQYSAVNGRLDAIQISVQNVAAANSGIAAEVKALANDVDEEKADRKEEDGLLKAEIIALRSQLSDLKAKVR